jgi:hypothetical protein
MEDRSSLEASLAIAERQSRFTFESHQEARFAQYHADHPEIYRALLRFALEARRAGRDRLSINALFERVRWETLVGAGDDTFKLNNNWRAHYARLLMRQEPALGPAFFETRTSRADTENL